MKTTVTKAATYLLEKPAMEVSRPSNELVPQAKIKSMDADKIASRPAEEDNVFWNWCLPEQPAGYIKSRKHDCL